jgi:hypothetical protein
MTRGEGRGGGGGGGKDQMFVNDYGFESTLSFLPLCELFSIPSLRDLTDNQALCPMLPLLV